VATRTAPTGLSIQVAPDQCLPALNGRELRTVNGEPQTVNPYAMRLAIEELIQKWLAENPNERLPGAGEPLNLDEYFRWPEDMRLAYSLLKNSGHVPEEVELLREIGQLKQRLAESTDEFSRKELQRRVQEQEVALNIKLERHRRR
jgi:hypothetical protein